MFDQREVGIDTKSYARGLKGALRQLPHIIFVGEMRDLTSMAIALTAGRDRQPGDLDHGDPVGGADRDPHHRLVPAPPAVADPLPAVADAARRGVAGPAAARRRPGRVAAREIMFVNQAIQNLIREDKIHQIPNVISTSLREDMMSLDDSLAELVERGAIAFETAYPYFDDVEKRATLQKRYYRLRRCRVRESGA